MNEHLDPFPCPRCGTTSSERVWGPCQACRAELVAAYGAVASREITSERFEPALHVVPNHVATKD